MGRYGRQEKVGSLGVRGCVDDGGNNNNARVNVFRITPPCAFVASLFETTKG